MGAACRTTGPYWSASLLMLLACLSADTAVPAPTPSKATVAHDWRTVVLQFAKQNFRHPAWGFSHCSRDYLLARELAAADHVTLDDDVLFTAAYLHDMAAFAPWAKDSVDHADEAARIVDTVLAGADFPMTKMDVVRGAIRTHMYPRDPLGNEALYLHDADALDWLGAIGVARMVALVDPNGGAPDGPAAVAVERDAVAGSTARAASRSRLSTRIGVGTG
jgi:uncharacterized protein